MFLEDPKKDTLQPKQILEVLKPSQLEKPSGDD